MLLSLSISIKKLQDPWQKWEPGAAHGHRAGPRCCHAPGLPCPSGLCWAVAKLILYLTPLWPTKPCFSGQKQSFQKWNSPLLLQFIVCTHFAAWFAGLDEHEAFPGPWVCGQCPAGLRATAQKQASKDIVHIKRKERSGEVLNANNFMGTLTQLPVGKW